MKKPKLVVSLSDQQAPYFDSRLHKLTLDFLDDQSPSEVIINGDLFDFPTLSKYTPREGSTATPHETLETGLALLQDYSAAMPNKANRLFIPGNHDERWSIYIWKHAIELASLVGNGLIDYVESAGWQYVGPGYPHSMYAVTPKLGIAHGWIVRKYSGATALAHMQHVSHSIIIGHTHRQAIVNHTYVEPDGSKRIIRGIEQGCMCVDLDYVVKPNWQQGFATAWVYEDGRFNVSLASYVNGELLWEGLRYK